MPDCDHCGRSFDAADDYLDHLAAEHDGELGAIERRRVDEHTSSDGVSIPPTAIYAVSGVLLFAVVAGGLYYVVGVFASEGQVHEHGTIEMTVDGEPVDFSQQQYEHPRELDPGQGQAFHFHGVATQWHMHPSEPGRLTLAEAMDWLGIEVTENYVAFEHATYSAENPDAAFDGSDPGTTVDVRVNDEPVDPASYELDGVERRPYEDGDHVEITIETSG